MPLRVKYVVGAAATVLPWKRCAMIQLLRKPSKDFVTSAPKTRHLAEPFVSWCIDQRQPKLINNNNHNYEDVDNDSDRNNNNKNIFNMF